MATPLAGAAKLGDTPARPMPKPTSCWDEDCTHFRLSLRPREAPTERLPCSGVWRPRAAVRDSAGGAAFIRRSACRQIAPYRDDKRHWLKATPCSPNNAWLDHSSLVHCLAWH